jgi:hypothetical protein
MESTKEDEVAGMLVCSRLVLGIHPENGSSKILPNTGILLQNYMALQTRIPQLESSPS